MRLGRKFAISRKGYWIATAALMISGYLAPAEGWLSTVILIGWFALYMARIRDAGRSPFVLLHLFAAMAIILAGALLAPEVFLKYIKDEEPASPPPVLDCVVFAASLAGGVAYYLWFSIWLGCVKAKPRATQAEIAENFT